MLTYFAISIMLTFR